MTNQSVSSQRLNLFDKHDDVDTNTEQNAKTQQTLGTQSEKAKSTIEPFYSTSEFLEEFRRRKIPTFSFWLNKMLYDGINTRCITEFCGPPGCGKTQMCHSLAVAAQLDSLAVGAQLDSLAVAAQLDGRKITGSMVLYIDTELTYNPIRIGKIALLRQLDVGQVFDNITIRKADSVAKQEQTLEQIPDLIKSNNIKLVIIDSVIKNYRAEFIGRSNLVERQQRLLKFMHALNTLAFNHDIAVVITNQVSDRPESRGKYKPTGGNVLGHSVTHRISLLEYGPVIFARLVKSAYYPIADCRLQIDESGVTDAEEEL